MMYAYSLIFAWSTWCVLSNQVNDGIVGKIMYAAVAIAALSAVLGTPESIAKTNVIIILSVAGIGIRHFILKKCKSFRGANR